MPTPPRAGLILFLCLAVGAGISAAALAAGTPANKGPVGGAKKDDDAPRGGFLYNALEEYGGAAQPLFPMGALDAWFHVIDDDSIRLEKVRSGGPLDDCGMRDRDEVTGVQVGRIGVPFDKNPKEYLHVLGEGIDAASAKNGGALLFKVRAGRDGGAVKAEPPRLGAFVPGHPVVKMAVEGKENKNEFFLRRCGEWLAKKQKENKLGAGEALNPGLAFAGLALLGSPNPDHEALAGQWAEAFQADWEKPDRKPVASPGGDQDSYGCRIHSEGWRILFLSEYNWRHPDSKRAAVLQKACDELAQCLLNPSYLYKEPSFRKHDDGTKDPRIPGKTYAKDAFAYVAKDTPRFPSFHGPAQPCGWRPDARELAMAWWCWNHCAETSGVTLSPKALAVARRYMMDLMPAAGAKAFPVDRETAAYFAHALAKSRNKEEAAFGMACAGFVVKSPQALIGDQGEFGMMATCALFTKAQGTAGYRSRFGEWRWYLSLMMQSDGAAHYCKLVPGLPYWEAKPLGANKEIVANGTAAFLLTAPARQLHMLGAAKPPAAKAASGATGK